jgi:hypothetical protein
MEALAKQGKLFAPERVSEEIQQVGSKGLQNWAKQHKSIFIPHDPALQAESQNIQFAYPDLIDNTTPFDEADRWVIALAKIKGFKVVTHETTYAAKKKGGQKPPRTLYIPDVCKAMTLPCIEFIELMRAEKWKF